MQIIKNIDPVPQSFGISLLAAILPLLMMMDVLSKRWIVTSIIIGLIILFIAWVDVPARQPGEKFHIRFYSASLFLFAIASILLVLASIFAPA